jgi:uncharacterized membrane protein YecN with MAPEG domain
MPFAITSIYAALLGILLIVLAGSVGRARSKGGPSLGTSGSDALVVADRRHMNFVENVPMALLLMALVEADGGAKGWVHALGVILLVSRLIHPFGLSTKVMNTPARGIGAGGTFFVILASAITLLWQAVR